MSEILFFPFVRNDLGIKSGSFFPPLFTFSIIFFFGDYWWVRKGSLLSLMDRDFEVVDRFIDYEVYKISKMLGIG